MPESTAPDETRLWIDRRDHIVAVDDAWDEFALANDGEDMVGERIRGRILHQFISGGPTRMYLDLMIQRARYGYDPKPHAYRCDSPDLRRFMEMRIEREDEDRLRFEHRVLRVESMPRRMEFFTTEPGSEGAVCRCSICNRIKVDRKTWSDPFDLGSLSVHRRPAYYSICPSCRTTQQELYPPGSWTDVNASRNGGPR